MDHRHHAAGHDHGPTSQTLRSKVTDAVNKALGIHDDDGLHDLLPGEGTQLHRAMLLHLQRPRTKVAYGEVNVYQGTVPHDEIARRRAANKRARKSRRINRIRNAA